MKCVFGFCCTYFFISCSNFVGFFRAKECQYHIWPQPTESRVSVRSNWRHGLWIKFVRVEPSHTRPHRNPGDPHLGPETCSATGGFREVFPHTRGAGCQREPSADRSHCHLCSLPDFPAAAEWDCGQHDASTERRTQKPLSERSKLVPVSQHKRRCVAVKAVHWRNDLSLLRHHYRREDWKAERGWKDQRWCAWILHKLV